MKVFLHCGWLSLNLVNPAFDLVDVERNPGGITLFCK